LSSFAKSLKINHNVGLGKGWWGIGIMQVPIKSILSILLQLIGTLHLLQNGEGKCSGGAKVEFLNAFP